MHDQTVTLFNRHGAANHWQWYPIVISGVTVNAVQAEHSTADAGKANGDTAELLIQAMADRSVKDAVSGEAVRYAGPKEYAALEDPAGFFTLAPDQDFFLLGETPADVGTPILDDEYDGGFYHAVNQAYDSVYLIHLVTFYSLIPHFEIGGR